MLRLSILPAILVLASCGGAETPAATTPEPAPAATETPATAGAMPATPENIQGPPTPWDQMEGHAKGQWMMDHVMPTMGPLFREFDPARYADFNCGTCHGEHARENHFAMPTPELPVLPGPTGDWAAYGAQHERMIQFMGGPVEHTMAALLGEQPYDPATSQGFGCYDCHTHQ